MSIPAPTFGHTPLVVGNFENDSDEATTNIKRRNWDPALKKALLIWGAHASSRAGDGVLAIANSFLITGIDGCMRDVKHRGEAPRERARLVRSPD
jgi:hypothetical protein